MKNLDTARKNCAAVLAEFYPKSDLMADMLENHGEYRSFWLLPSGTVLEAKSDNVFDGQAMTYIYELKYKRPLGWPIAS